MPGEDLTYGVEASPFLLKMEACLNYLGRPFRRLPRDGGRLENFRQFASLNRARKNGTIQRYPGMDAELDEYPGVPFYKPAGSDLQYDSSGMALWLDQQSSDPACHFFPSEPRLRFMAQLIDEAFDEFGLYMVHHNRWVTSASDTQMPDTFAEEMGRLFPWPIKGSLHRKIGPRQTRRTNYLFSIAPEGFTADVLPHGPPPSRAGFPPTHRLLDEAWHDYLSATEFLLAQQPYLLGERFTIADASAYGQLSMNLIDPGAASIIESRAPRTFQWLMDIRDGKHSGGSGELRADAALAPLITLIGETFIPLMEQNYSAWEYAKAQGQRLFNEAAFDRGEALYDGELRGHPFRSVVKTFQVRVWKDLQSSWQQLSSEPLTTSALLDCLE